MKRTSLFVAVAFIGLVWAACGGRAALGPIEEIGEGGSSNNSNTSSTGGGMGGATSTAVTTVTTGPVVVTAVTAVSTGTGPGTCDFSGDCGICVNCAFEGPCNALWNACFSNPDCAGMANCVQMCQGQPGCFQQCFQQFPGGGQQYIEALQCLLCDECEFDCDGQTPGMLCSF